MKIIILMISYVLGVKCSGISGYFMPPTILTLQMIIDFAVEKNWKQVILFDCIGDEDCDRTYAKPLLECFFKKGIYVTMKSMTEQIDLPKIMRVEIHRVGVILLLDDIDLNLEDNFLRKIVTRNKNSRSAIFGDYASWLLLSTKWNNSQIFDAVKDWPIGVDSDVSIAMSFLTVDVILDVLRQFFNKTCENLRNYERRYDYAQLRRSQSVAPPETTFVQDTSSVSRTIMVFYTVVVYKIRVDTNASLEMEDWNTWNPSRRFTNKQNLPKQRSDLRKYSMRFGLQNSSKFYGENDEQTDTKNSEHTSSVETLTELIHLFEICLNVTANITNYVFRETAQVTKENNDLVHGITGGEIDIGAAYFDVDLDRNKLLSFSYPIVHFTRSIYFKPPDTSSNIFLQPFSPQLLLCVFATLLLIIAVMEIINYITFYIHWKEDKEHFGLGEATLWCLSIMCMQGSPWEPRTQAGKAVLLSSLIFALIISNAYSGFITSILSVKINMINNVSDFFEYDYTYGCSKSDDNYIILKDELRNFYVKALEANQMKIPETEGLERTINGSYAFFISETVAKRIFRNALRFQRCKISELQTNTPGTLALPISNDSPYKRIINTSILRMWQYGMLRKLTLMIKPPLLDCLGTLNYKRASLQDVYGAFCILAVGSVAAIILFFLERAWAGRQRLSVIQRRIAGKTKLQLQAGSRRSRLVTVRLPMRILGLDRELTRKFDSAGSNFSKKSVNCFRSKKKKSRGKTLVKTASGDQLLQQTFPYFP